MLALFMTASVSFADDIPLPGEKGSDSFGLSDAIIELGCSLFPGDPKWCA